ncbi:cell division cycle 20.2, cofactor of APC complex-like [Telopea speciosissima]|uniref:cell division cycle 20.2, cofactor of APC complex-like n=1 Tax=Telopea speciosissima TaxID=54955 RepID=UPI001CC41AC2|nr:cell division cycle 20.2, cofactor of APC complex-like [Telopea speciosissima]
MWRLEWDGYSPKRLLSNPVDYYFPGDRFIPNRSLMDIGHAQSLLTSRTKEGSDPKPGSSVELDYNNEYKRKVEEILNLDSEGRPFRMLVFRGSPKTTRRYSRLIEVMEQDRVEITNNFKRSWLPKSEEKILHAPLLKANYYLNILDWGKNNVLAVALGSEVYLWNANNGLINKLKQTIPEDHYPTSVAWSEDTKTMAIGLSNSGLQLWDAETLQMIRSLDGHRSSRVGSLSWNRNCLASGGHDRSIISHDVRASTSSTSCLRVHTAEVCGLKWSRESNLLASGGNDNIVYIWDASSMKSSKFLHKFSDHHAAVKSLAWCPYQFKILASGGGLQDRCIKLWNLQSGKCINSRDTSAQVCGLEWNRHRKEILSGHGYSLTHQESNLCLWKYPSLSKVGELKNQISEVLYLSQNPDGSTVVSAGIDETLRFWKVFGPPKTNSLDFDSLLSLERLHIR